jgi:hypothetical protein
MPTFADGKYARECLAIGRMLTGYGELELEMCQVVGAAIGDLDAAIRDIFRMRGEERRIRMAKTNLYKSARSEELLNLAKQFIADMDWCREIRNQYAHCQWLGTAGDPLGFINLEEVAEVIGPTGPLDSYRRDVDLTLLGAQEQFFGYVKTFSWYLAQQFRIQAGGTPKPIWDKPPFFERPQLYSPSV